VPAGPFFGLADDGSCAHQASSGPAHLAINIAPPTTVVQDRGKNTRRGQGADGKTPVKSRGPPRPVLPKQAQHEAGVGCGRRGGDRGQRGVLRPRGSAPLLPAEADIKGA
jgi:hypothetical protein